MKAIKTWFKLSKVFATIYIISWVAVLMFPNDYIKTAMSIFGTLMYFSFFASLINLIENYIKNENS